MKDWTQMWKIGLRSWLVFDEPDFRIDLSEIIAEIVEMDKVILISKYGIRFELYTGDRPAVVTFNNLLPVVIKVYTTVDNFNNLKQSLKDHHKRNKVS